MEISGKIVSVLPVQNIQGKNANYQKQEFILETGGQHSRKVAVSLWGEDKITKYDLEPGLVVKAQVDAESREHNGRWYTDLKAFRITWDNQQVRNWQPGGE